MRKDILCLDLREFRDAVESEIRIALEEEAVRKAEIRGRVGGSEADIKIKVFELKQATLSPATLAARLGIGESTLRQRYETPETGTVGKAITAARLARAARLLEHRKATTLVRDIALDCGWADARAVAKAFREVSGCDPSQYQASCEAVARNGVARAGDAPAGQVSGSCGEGGRR